MSEPAGGTGAGRAASRIVVVGASAAGLTAAETLRRGGFAGEIVMVGDEDHPPYDRPPLSKQVLQGRWEPARTALRPQAALDALRCTWLLGTPAAGLDRERAVVRLGDGRELPYDKLIVATGVRARTLPYPVPPRTFTLRSLQDAERLAAHLRPGASMAVIGGGFLGAETAAVAAGLGLSVTLIDVLEAPMVRQLGTALAARLARLHREHGVAMVFGTGVARMSDEGGRTRLHLGDGAELDADLVLVAIGSLPNTEWLAGSGLDIADGLLCDEFSMAGEEIAGAGDVARWYHPGAGRHIRLEHRMNATEQGMHAARNLLGGERRPFAPVPYFWTDQYDVKIQAYGFPGGDAEVEIVTGSLDQDRFAALYRRRGRTVGALTWNLPREARELRQLVVEELASAPGP
jgi:3-phenylpropionate/trans-cinnamate dioxygenase ferredoxin reductase component